MHFQVSDTVCYLIVQFLAGLRKIKLPPGPCDSNNRGHQSSFQLNNSNYRKFYVYIIFCNCHCWVWNLTVSLYCTSQNIPERCETPFVDYQRLQNYEKLCYSLWQKWNHPVSYLLLCSQLNWDQAFEVIKYKLMYQKIATLLVIRWYG